MLSPVTFIPPDLVSKQKDRMTRILLLTLPFALAACSDVSAPPPPPPPGVPTDAARRNYPESTAFPPNFTIVLTREYGMWKYRAYTLEIDLFLSTYRARLECVTTEDNHEKFITDRPGFDATRLRQLAEAADLYGPNNIGEDLTPTDGAFDTLRFRPVAGGRAVVLVTSGNRSFEDQPARRELLEYLNRIKSDLREKAELASAGQGPDFR
jgi:hypothetical protein